MRLQTGKQSGARHGMAESPIRGAPSRGPYSISIITRDRWAMALGWGGDPHHGVDDRDEGPLPAPVPHHPSRLPWRQHRLSTSGMRAMDHRMESRRKILARIATPHRIKAGLFGSAPLFFRTRAAPAAPFRAISAEIAAPILVRSLLTEDGRCALDRNRKCSCQHPIPVTADSGVGSAFLAPFAQWSARVDRKDE